MLGSTLSMQASTIRLDVLRLLELGIKLEGIEASLSNCKLPDFDSIIENELRVLIPPLPQKKRQNLKFTGL
jgi:hypothetical protein